MTKILTIIIFCLTPFILLAGPTDRIMKELLPRNTVYNKNSFRVIKDQSGGLLSAGSIATRGPVPQNFQPFVLRTPSFEYDPCNGNGDFRFGGFSFISSKEFLNSLHNSAKSVGPYAAKIYIKEHCNVCETVMTELEEIARTVNQFNIDQCAMSENIARGFLSKIYHSDKQHCLMQDNVLRRSKDLADSTAKCKANPNVHHREMEDPQNADKKKELDSLLGSEFNLVWKALGKNQSINNKEFAEIIMSISGTIIGQHVNKRWEFSLKESLFQDSEQLAAIMGLYEGKKAQKYHCDDEQKCLKVSIEDINLADKPLYRHVTDTIESLTQKVADNAPRSDLTPEEEALISFSSIPIIGLIEQTLISQGHNANVLVSEGHLIELICYDMITDFLTKLADLASRETKSLSLGSNEPEIIEIFIGDLDKIKRRLNEHKMTVFKRFEETMRVKEYLQVRKDTSRLTFAKVFSNSKQ